MKILFLDQSGQLGGAELSLSDVAQFYQQTCLVGLFADGPFREWLESHHIPVQVFNTQPINVSKDSRIWTSLGSIGSLIPLIVQVANLAHHYDLIYANTQKALVVGALASLLSRRPLVYHLRDILSADHFSRTNRTVAVTLANQVATLIITNSHATKNAFIAAGGRKEKTAVVYNGFDSSQYQISEPTIDSIRQELDVKNQFIIGHFSRLSPWKGQHILLEALVQCPREVTAIFVGDALFGENDYVNDLHQQVIDLKLQERVKFLGFRADIIPLMKACDLIAHTSTAPEPFGRVIIEAMLCDRPVVAAAAGGVIELIKPGQTGWLFSPGNSQELAEIIINCRDHPEPVNRITHHAKIEAIQRFDLKTIHQQLDQLLNQRLSKT